MPPTDGEVVEFDYELWVEGEPKLHDTTLRAAAEREGILQADAWYGPMHYVIGSGRIVPGLDRALRAATIGEPLEVDLPPSDAYGARDPKLIDTVPFNEFRKNDVTPEPGLQVSYKNRRGVVTTVGGGRVRVDFNPPLAGKRLRYRVTLRKVAKGDDEKIAGLLQMEFPAPIEWKVKVETVGGTKTATVEVPSEAVYARAWLVSKARTLVDVERYTEIERVRFVEAYDLPREKAVTQPTART